MALRDAVHDYYEAVDLRDLERVLSLFAEDAVYERPGYATFRGRHELRTFYEIERIIDTGTHRITSTVASGRTVAVQGSFEGRTVDGHELSLRFADFFEGDREIDRRLTYFFAPLA